MWTRRSFLHTTGLTLGAFGLVPRAAARAVLVAGDGDGVLVTIFLRGGMDGLAAVQPLEDRQLARSRPELALTAADLVPLEDRFGLHPALAPLEELWRAGDLGVVHGVGLPTATRSHFEAQDTMEAASASARDGGWLNRLAGRFDDASPLAAVAVADALPRSLAGRSPAVAAADLRSLARSSSAGAADDLLEALYDSTTGDLMDRRAMEAAGAIRDLDGVLDELSRSRVGYPRSPLGRSLAQVAALVRAEVGLRVACCDSEGWDTHAGQGAEQGAFARSAGELAASLTAFWEDLGEHRSRVTVLTMTEFGRTVAANGARGTDHGRASCSFVVGEGLGRGGVLGTVPALATENLEAGRDLPVTTDYRALFAGAADRALDLPDPETLFPGWTGRPLTL